MLLCDEATSALDSRTEKEILDSLLTLAEGRTSIFVAHRLSTAAQCDKIVVLENVRPQHNAACACTCIGVGLRSSTREAAQALGGKLVIVMPSLCRLQLSLNFFVHAA